MKSLALLLAGACVAQAQTQPLERRLSAVTDGEKCDCNPLTDISQYTTCKLERNPFGMMAVVVKSAHNHRCVLRNELLPLRFSLSSASSWPSSLPAADHRTSPLVSVYASLSTQSLVFPAGATPWSS